MPKNAKKNYKKGKSYYRKIKRYHKKQLYNQGVPSGMPFAKLATLRYSETVNLAGTAGILQRYAFSANSVYDPNNTGGGHQPMGYDQWTTLYNKYVVLGSKIIVRMIPNFNGVGQIGSGVAGVHLSDGPTPPYSTANEYIESRKGTWRIINWNGGLLDISQTIMVSKFSAKKFFNVKDVRDNQDLRSTTGKNPDTRAYFIVWLDSPMVDTQYSAIVTIDYIVSFSDPVNLPKS